MSKEIIIDSSSNEVSIALLEDKKLVELHKEATNQSYTVGDIYLGRVRRIHPGLNAAFVDVGYEKDAFLHYLDLGPQVRSLMKFTKMGMSGKGKAIKVEDMKLEQDIQKTGKMNSVLHPNQQVLVQIAKEPISTKGPRICSELSIAGRFIVLVPFSNRISISQKIKSVEERNRLKRLLQSIKPNNFGVIIRTVAENQKVAELVADLDDLMNKWNKMSKKLYKAKSPYNVLRELDRSTSLVRDLLNDQFNSVFVNDPDLQEELKSYIKSIAPDKADIVKIHKGKKPIFEHFNIDNQIKSSFGKKVTMKNGSYLIIEHTEALHVIDVNSGHRTSKEANQESNALLTNIEAAKEIARQLRLRDMGGIIVIDFIDMVDKVHRKKLFDTMKEVMKNDNAKHSILPPSKFGLIQITRQRVRPELNMKTLEKCPVCDGTGEIKASITLLDEIENNLRFLLQEQNESNLRLSVHPFVYAYLTKGIFSIKFKWYRKFRKKIKVIPANSHHLLEYHFFNKFDDEINF